MSLPPAERRRIDARLAEWLARIGGEAREDDDRAFQAWLDERREHRTAYEDFRAIRHMVDGTSLGVPPLTPARRSQVSASLVALALSASIILGCGVAWVLTSRQLVRSPETARQADGGVLRLVNFGDGGAIYFDRDARATFGRDARGRVIELVTGRARFSSGATPFRVGVGDLQLSARNTVFDIDVRGAVVTVMVLDGKLTVLRQGHPARSLGARQILTVAPAEETLNTVPRERGDWTVTMLPLDGRTLGDIVAIVAREGGPKLVLGEPSLAGLTLQGQLRATDVGALSRQLAAALDLAVARRGHDYVLERK